MVSWVSKIFGGSSDSKEETTPPANQPNPAAPSPAKPASSGLNVIQPGSGGSAQPRPSPGLNVLQAASPGRTPQVVQIGAARSAPAPRTVVQAPVLVDEAEVSAWSNEIRIKARPNPKEPDSCDFLVDRPVFKGHSVWIPDAASAKDSPLAQALFGIKGVASVLIHEMTVTVTRDSAHTGGWKAMATEIGARIREHLKNDRPVVSEEFRTRIPSESDIRTRLQTLIDEFINPGIAGHSGVITLKRVEGNTAYIHMGGGCQGCAASTLTLKQGIHTSFREAVPELGAILDETDHAAGKNPFFRDLSGN